jgi:hypothetical protein
VVDLKPVNLRFYRDSLYIAMLDCDGFSIQGHAERFPAEQFTADYLAPEFQRKGMPAGTEMAQDRFALAVVIFQLLNFGIHPYSGRPGHAQAPTDIPGRIRDGYYAYGVQRHKGMAPNATSGHALMPPELRAMFDRAFSPSPRPQRPSAADWAQLLRAYAQRSGGKLAVCAVNPEHQHFAGLGCAACAREQVIAAAAQASVQRSSRLPAAAAQRRRTAPGQAPAAVPLAGNTGGAITGKGWAVVVVLIVLFLIGFTASTSSSDETKDQAALQAQADRAAGLEAFSWRPARRPVSCRPMRARPCAACRRRSARATTMPSRGACSCCTVPGRKSRPSTTATARRPSCVPPCWKAWAGSPAMSRRWSPPILICCKPTRATIWWRRPWAACT